MTEAHTTHSGSHPDDRSLRFDMAARLENLAMMRTVVAAAATVDDLDMDMVADLKLATDEACTRLVRSSVPNAMLVVRLTSIWTGWSWRCIHTVCRAMSFRSTASVGMCSARWRITWKHLSARTRMIRSGTLSESA